MYASPSKWVEGERSREKSIFHVKLLCGSAVEVEEEEFFRLLTHILASLLFAMMYLQFVREKLFGRKIHAKRSKNLFFCCLAFFALSLLPELPKPVFKSFRPRNTAPDGFQPSVNNFFVLLQRQQEILWVARLRDSFFCSCLALRVSYLRRFFCAAAFLL